jgi:hypothetical protein
MDISGAIDQLAKWCAESNGAPIEIAPGRTLTFASHAIFGQTEIDLLEQQLGFHLPSAYRRFMGIIGQSILFQEPRYASGGLYFYKPEEAINASLAIWEGEAEAGSDRFCFIGCHRSMGDYFGFVIDRPDLKNFDVFCHEYPPGEYVDVSNEIGSWRTFDEWIIRAVESSGEDTL